MDKAKLDQMDADEYIRTISKATDQEQAALFRWLGQQRRRTHLETFRLQGDLASQHLRTDYIKEFRHEYYYAMFIVALRKVRHFENAIERKTPLSQPQLGEISKRRMSKIDAKRGVKGSPKKDLINRLYPEISNFIDAGKSWRWIADYIETYHKKNLTHSYIRQCYFEIKNEQPA